MNNKIEQALNFDPLYAVEKCVQKHWGEFNGHENSLSLGLAISSNENKRKLLKESKDTYFGMTWDYYINLLKNLEFVKIYENKYVYSNFGKPCDELVTLHFNSTYELFVWSQSYNNMTTLNKATIYGHYFGDRVSLGSNGWCDKSSCWHFDFDCREGMTHKLNKLIENEKVAFANGKWSERFLWFLNLDDTKEDGYDYKSISNRVINRLPENYRNILTR